MKRVIQKDRTGCGLACIAMLAGRTYQEVRKAAIALHIEKAGQFYTHTTHLKELGAVFNVHIPAKPEKTKTPACAGVCYGLDSPQLVIM